jgi:hypothetical protein
MTKKFEETPEESASVNQEAMSTDELLDSLKGKFDSCIVTGFNKDGHLFMSSSISNIPFMHWTLNRSIFELGLFEKQASQPQTEEAPATTEVDTEASES